MASVPQTESRSFTKWLFSRANPFRPSPFAMIVSYILLGSWAFIVLFPLYWLVITAFKLPIDVAEGPKYLPWIDFTPSLHAWQELLFDETAGNFVTRPYINTVIVAVISSILVIVIGALASYALMRFEYRPKLGTIFAFLIIAVVAGVIMVTVGIPWFIMLPIAIAVFIAFSATIGKRFKRSVGNEDIAFWIISQRILPPVAIILPLYIVFQNFGMLNTHAALIITYTGANLPIAVWFMRDYFAGIPYEIEESAFIDGASRYQVFFLIVLPLAVPGIIATFLIILIFAWNEYILALFLSGADTQTMPMLVVSQNATRGPQWWNISALVMMMIAPIILVALVLERYIARGLLVGAVKG
jgi:multiple sugar transport system permease protein